MNDDNEPGGEPTENTTVVPPTSEENAALRVFWNYCAKQEGDTVVLTIQDKETKQVAMAAVVVKGTIISQMLIRAIPIVLAAAASAENPVIVQPGDKEWVN